MSKSFQGASKHTERKEFEIGSIANMRFLQFKSQYFQYKNIYVADVFCGTGRNVVEDELIDGSPVRLMDGISKANNSNIDVNYFFSDIRPDACASLTKYLIQRFNQQIATHTMSAKDAVNMLGEILKRRSDIFLFLVLDPNGPKDFPRQEVCDLLKAFPKRVDVIPYISATAVNRSIGARNTAGMQMNGYLGWIENFDDGFVSILTNHGRFGWIRKPLENDRQRWVIIPTYGCFKPRNDWQKQGYIDLDTVEGRNIVKFYCGKFI